MRLIISFFCLSFAVQALAQESAIAQIIAQNTAQEFIAVLAAHPDKDAVKTLESDVKTGKIRVVLDKQMALTSFEGWDRTAAGVVFKLTAQKTLTLPNDFFSYNSCARDALTEVIGLAYDYISKLPSDQLKLLARFADPDLVEDIDNEDQANLYKLVTGFEGAATDNAGRFSELLFKACSQQEIAGIFGASGSSAENFARAAKEQIRYIFEGLRLLIQQ